MDHPKAVADAASTLLGAIQAARAAGYRVPFPDHALIGVSVSETARTAAAIMPLARGPDGALGVADEPPVPVIGRASKGA